MSEIKYPKKGGAKRATEAITQLRKEAVKDMVKGAVEFNLLQPFTCEGPHTFENNNVCTVCLQLIGPVKEERFLRRTGVIRAKPSR